MDKFKIFNLKMSLNANESYYPWPPLKGTAGGSKQNLSEGWKQCAQSSPPTVPLVKQVRVKACWL